MKFHPRDTFLNKYLEQAPAALALERTVECQILCDQAFSRPVLDIGCGDGIFASILFNDEIDLGVDINSLEVENAEETAKYKELQVTSASSISADDKTFQTVFSNSVLEHIEDLVPILKEVRRVMADDGTFYVTLPTDKFVHASLLYRAISGAGLRNLASSFENFYNKFWRHHHYYSPEGWKRFFEENGFVVDAQRVYGSKQFCTVNDGFAYVALPSFVSKKLLNRWFFFPALRKATVPLWAGLLQRKIEMEEKRDGFGLIFLKLKKKVA